MAGPPCWEAGTIAPTQLLLKALELPGWGWEVATESGGFNGALLFTVIRGWDKNTK